MTRIYLDAMGGDNAPKCTAEGAIEALRADSDLRITLGGDAAQLTPLLMDCDDVRERITVEGVECSEDTVKDGTYKIQRPFVFVTNDSAPLSEQAQAFFHFATSTDAADLIRTAGAVPVNE